MTTDRRPILVVDDDEAVRHSLERAFATQGYQVFAAAGGEEALELVRKEAVQVIFLDLWMPAMTGIEICGRIRQVKPISIIHAVTGYASLFDLLDCRQAGFDDYFTKPVDLPALFHAASEAFEKLGRWKQA